MVDTRAGVEVWRSVRRRPAFARLLAVRVASQFADGLFQAGLAGALLFNPERAADPWQVAASFAVLFLPYSLIGPFAGALLDRWDRRWVLVGANFGRLVMVAVVGVLLAVGAGDLPILCGALIVNGFTRFVASGLSAALPHVVAREDVVAMNSLSTAVGAVATFVGANFMLLPRWLLGSGDTGAATVISAVTVPVVLSLVTALRFSPRVLGPDDTARAVHGSVAYAVATGWAHGLRTVARRPSVAATLSALGWHRIAFGCNTLLVLVLVRHTDTQAVAGFGIALVFVAATGTGSFLATVVTPTLVRRIGRYATANWALGAGAAVQLAGIGLQVPVLLTCGFLIGAAGQVVKLCADTAMQIDVDDALRGHVFAVQDSLFWVTFIAAIAAAAAVIPADGRAPGLAVAGVVAYLAGLATHAVVGRRSED
ncbi:MFS transporter [Mycobacterium sp. MYCO198283]|uniref:MFS transporter n=1 Tax=Mycobacterium sp. MYCO198283 TaxID=2883505 RepID=UPI001E5C96A3|nr:MFS transporter [Mycobacterium sp. MYCO198283]MCG5434127.1 MFS transporter [Mycobacterium sp. MYCO198283]